MDDIRAEVIRFILSINTDLSEEDEERSLEEIEFGLWFALETMRSFPVLNLNLDLDGIAEKLGAITNAIRSKADEISKGEYEIIAISRTIGKINDEGCAKAANEFRQEDVLGEKISSDSYSGTELSLLYFLFYLEELHYHWAYVTMGLIEEACNRENIAFEVMNNQAGR